MSSAGAGAGAPAVDQRESARAGFVARRCPPADTPDDVTSVGSGGSGAWPGALLLHVRRSCATARRSVDSPPTTAVICSGVMPHVIGRRAGAAQLVGDRAAVAERAERDAHVPEADVTVTGGTAGMVSEHRTSRGPGERVRRRSDLLARRPSPRRSLDATGASSTARSGATLAGGADRPRGRAQPASALCVPLIVHPPVGDCVRCVVDS